MLTTGLTSAFLKFPKNAMNPRKSTTSPCALERLCNKVEKARGTLLPQERIYPHFQKKKYFPDPLFPGKKENLSDAIDWGTPVM